MRCLLVSLVLLVVASSPASSMPTEEPLNLEATLSADATNVTLHWSAAQFPGATYRVYRGDLRVAEVTNTTWYDATPGPLTAYTVTTVDAAGEGPGTMVVVSAIGFCGALPVQGRGALFFVSMDNDLCDDDPGCAPDDPLECVPGLCPLLHVGLVPPSTGIRQECVPHSPSGGRTFRVAV